MPADYGVITLRGSRSKREHDLGETKITRQTCCIHQDLSGSFPSQMLRCPAFPHSSFSEHWEPLGRNVRGGRDWDETFRLAYQTFFGSSPCSNRLPAAPRMGINGSAHPELTCHQILASFFQVHVGDRRESGRSQVCAPAPITQCHTDPDPAEPSSTQEIARVSPPQELRCPL